MRAYLLLFFACFAFQTLQAQMEEPVKWSFELKQVSDTEYDVIFNANIDRGWSVYSQYLDQGGPIPTSFSFDAGVQIEGKAKEVGNKKETYDSVFGMNLVKFTDRARFTQRITVEKNVDVIKGYVTYMTCDESSCLPPTDVNFNLEVE